MEQENKQYSVTEFLNTIFKHKRKILFIFFATVITVTVGTFMMQPTYESSTSIMVKLGRENVYRPEVGTSAGVIQDSANNPDKILNTEIKILTSKDLMENVIEAIGLETLYPNITTPPKKSLIKGLVESGVETMGWSKLFPSLGGSAKSLWNPLDSAVKNFQAKLSVSISRNSNVIDISFKHTDPVIVASTLNLLVKLFKEKHIEVFRNSLSSLYNKQLFDYEKKMINSERELEIFKAKNKIFSHGEQSTLLLTQHMDMDKSIKNTQNRVRELKEKIYSLEKQIKTIPETQQIQLSSEANRYRVIDSAKSNLLGLKRRESELMRKYKNFRAGSQELQGVREEIKIVEIFLAKQEKALKDNVGTTQTFLYQQTKLDLIKATAELTSLVAKEANLKTQLRALDKDMVDFDRGGREFKMLMRKFQSNQKNFEIYVQKVEEANISSIMDELKMDNIKVIQEATVPSLPIAPKKKLNIMMSIFFGAFAGIGLAFLSEYFRKGVPAPRVIENRLGVPVIASIMYKG